jgi:NADH-quinone oxidoreductase subunit B
LIILQKKIEKEKLSDAEWYKKDFHEEIPVPILGPDLIDPRKYQLFRKEDEISKEELVIESDAKGEEA